MKGTMMKDDCTWAVREVMRELGNEGKVLEASAYKYFDQFVVIKYLVIDILLQIQESELCVNYNYLAVKL